MAIATCLTSPTTVVVADASVIINLNASGCAQALLAAIPNPVAVVDVVLAELEAGQRSDRQHGSRLESLASAGVVRVVTLSDQAERRFEELVIGAAADTLDDGEAATIAYAIQNDAIPLVDERKATRLCGKLFPELTVGCTVDLFLHPEASRALPEEGLADALYAALRHGRMRVLPHHLDWVLAQIGSERAALCGSLPRSVRERLAV